MTVLTLTMLALAASAARAQQASDSSRLASFLVLTRKQLQHPLRAATVDRTTMTIGRRADGSPFVVDLTRPASPGRMPLPVVILVHGGLTDDAPVRPRSWQVYKDWGTTLAASGVAAVMFDHSLGSPKRRLDLAMSEIDIVLRWVTTEGARLGLKTDSVQAVGFSAAGLLAPELLRDERPVPISRMALFYPLTGIVPATETPLHDDVLTARMDLRGAAQKLANRRTPLLLIRAGSDMQPGLLSLLDKSMSALLSADVRLEIINVPGEPHGFDLEHDTPDVRAAIERTLRFVTGKSG